jgi:hypothetical protein
MSTVYVSDYAKLSNGGRVFIPLIGTSNANGAQLFVQDRSGGLLTSLKFADHEEALLELGALSEQIDAWEIHQAEKREAAETRKPIRR